MRSSDSATLNVFLVNALQATVGGVPSGATVHGYGLTSSNGSLIGKNGESGSKLIGEA